MNHKKNNESDWLDPILKKHGIDLPSENFSHQLRHNLIQQYAKTVVKPKLNESLGRSILVLLLLVSFFVLYRLDPFAIAPEVFGTIAAFMIGLCILIVMVKKSKVLQS